MTTTAPLTRKAELEKELEVLRTTTKTLEAEMGAAEAEGHVEAARAVQTQLPRCRKTCPLCGSCVGLRGHPDCRRRTGWTGAAVPWMGNGVVRDRCGLALGPG